MAQADKTTATATTKKPKTAETITKTSIMWEKISRKIKTTSKTKITTITTKK